MIRRNHLFTFEAFLHVLVVGLAVSALAVALQSAGREVPVLSPEPKQVVPAFGEQGFKVDLFCADPLTTVTKNRFSPIDSPFAASYTLDRTKQGIHETVIVNVYPEPERQPVGTYMEDQDAFVNKDAIKCIEDKAR